MVRKAEAFHKLFMESLADELKQKAKERGMSQRELARRLGFSPMYVSDLFTKRRSLTQEIVEKLVKILY
jgi:transcriptional regulator with XRE-family HTH domain